MAIQPSNLIQCTDSTSSEAGWASSANVREQRETLQFDIKNADGTPYKLTVDDLNQLEVIILGRVSDTVSTDGRLNRRIPVSHPIRRGFYANARSALEGSGVPVPVDGGNTPGNVKDPVLNPFLLPRALIYPENRVSVEFTPRLYPVLPNEYISIRQSAWYDDSNAKQTFNYADEWIRYTDVDFHPKDDWISFTLGGQMKFITGQPNPPTPDGAQYAQMPRIRMPNSTLKVTWYQVPYRYVTSPNSYLEKYKGRINQSGWWRWGPGKLLYINYTPVRCQQPNPTSGQINSINPTVGFDNPSPTVYPFTSYLQTCDIEMEFILTTRVLAPGDTPVPSQPGFIVGGHNLLPWGSDRKFHYAETASPGVPPVPFWGSAPFELFLTDPDLIQAGV